MNRFLKAVALPALVSRVMKQLDIQKKFLRQYTDPILADAMLQNDGSLSQHDLDKINKYYALAVPAILGEAFCALRGNNMSWDERWASTCQGAMTGLFDDFFDKDYLSDEAVEKMIRSEDIPADKKSNQKLFDVFYKKALQHAPDKNIVQQTLLEVYNAQVASKKQVGSTITKEEMTEITFHKGGSSLIFYRSAFSPAATGKEKKIIYDLGGSMQLSNDIFDVYKDREAAIKTLVTETNSIKELRSFYKDHLDIYYSNAYEAGFPAKNVKAFLDILSIGIFSRCFVCLDQLEKNEKLTGNMFSVHEYSRKQLICDMDKKTNMLRSAWVHINKIPSK